MPEGFTVNDFDALAVEKRERNGWGFTREDLEKYGVLMVTDVRLVWDESTPVEMRKVFAEASHVLHFIAERAVMDQLTHDKLKPTEQLDLLYGDSITGEHVLLRKSDWHPVGSE
jgi:hypothetical protein